MRKFNVIAPTDIGTFIINRNDAVVGWKLSTHGTYDAGELQAIGAIVQMLRQQRGRDVVAFDVGANIGVISVFLSDLVGPSGKVFAFEAQRIVFYMLAGNVAINSKNNVYCHHYAISDSKQVLDIPGLDYGVYTNFGSLELGGEQKEFIGQTPSTQSSEKVEAIALDDLEVDALDFLKIDVEGMELRVLAGGARTIARCRPIILAEHLKSDVDEMKAWFRRHSFKIYAGVGHNFICIPEEFGIQVDGMTEAS